MSTPFTSSSSPLLRLLLPLAAGIAVGEFFYPYLTLPTALFFVSTLAVGLLTVSTLFLRRNFAPRSVEFGIYLTTFLLGVTLLHHDRACLSSFDERQAQVHYAVVTDAPRLYPGQWRVKCRLIAPDPQAGRFIDLSLTDTTQRHSTFRPPSSALHVGTRLLLHTRITSPCTAGNPGEPDRAAYLRRQDISGSAHCYAGDWQRSLLPVDLTLREHLLLVRTHLISHYQAHLDRHTAALLAAITLGDRTGVDRSTRALYSQSGAGHLLALSGLHLAFLYSLYTFIVVVPARRAGRKWHVLSTLLSLIGIWLFALVAGLPISLIRAALMFSISAVIGLFSRDGRGLHSLQLTILFLLLCFPQWLFDLGFQLSCLAVAGILLIAPLLPPPATLEILTPRGAELAQRQPDSRSMRLLKLGLQAVWQLLVVSFSAQLATAPLIAYVFARFPWAGLLSSLFVIPLAYLLLGGSVLFLLLLPFRALIAAFLTATLSLLEHLLAYFSQGFFAPFALHPSLLTTVAAYLLLAAALYVAHHRKKLIPAQRLTFFFLPFILLVFSVLADDYRHRQHSDRLLVYHTYPCTAVHLLCRDGHSFVLSTDTARARSALRTTALHHWEPLGLQPTFLRLSSLRHIEGCDTLTRRTRLNAFAPGVLLYRGVRIAIIDHPLSHSFPEKPLHVDYLLITREGHRPLSHLLRFYRPRTLLLSADLSSYYRQHFTVEARRRQLEVYDIAEKGYFELTSHL